MGLHVKDISHEVFANNSTCSLKPLLYTWLLAQDIADRAKNGKREVVKYLTVIYEYV